MRRKQVKAFCSFRSPRDRTVIWRVAVFLCRRVSLRGFVGVILIFAFSVWAFSVYYVLLSRSGFMCVFLCFVRVFFLLFLPEIRKTTWKSMFPHRIYRISQKNSSIVDSPGFSISLASRLSHKAKTVAPK